MKTTRILLAGQSGVLSEAALRLRRMLPKFPPGACAVRSAGAQEPLTEWHPDLVLLDPNRDENGNDGATPPPRPNSRVLVLSFSYEQFAPTLPKRSRRRQGARHLACVSAQAVEMTGSAPAGDLDPEELLGVVRGPNENFRPRSPGFSP